MDFPIAGNEQFKGYHNMGDEFQNRDYRMNSYVGAPTTVIKLSGTIGFGGYGVQKFMCPGTKDKKKNLLIILYFVWLRFI